METVKNIPQVTQEDKYTCSSKHMAGDEGIPESFELMPSYTLQYFFNMAVGHHFPSLCSGIRWPRSVKPLTGQRGVAGWKEGTGLCPGVSHRPVWNSGQSKQHDFWNLGLLQETAR